MDRNSPNTYDHNLFYLWAASYKTNLKLKMDSGSVSAIFWKRFEPDRVNGLVRLQTKPNNLSHLNQIKSFINSLVQFGWTIRTSAHSWLNLWQLEIHKPSCSLIICYYNCNGQRRNHTIAVHTSKTIHIYNDFLFLEKNKVICIKGHKNKTC